MAIIDQSWFVPEALFFAIVSLAVAQLITNYFFEDNKIGWSLVLIGLTVTFNIVISLTYFYVAALAPEFFSFLTEAQKESILVIQFFLDMLLSLLLIYSHNRNYF